MASGAEFFERLNNRPGSAAFLNALKWDANGLVTVVAQDAANNEVLGVAFANRAALKKTLETGLLHYFSRSRNKLWLKGEESGHIQRLVELRTDCDGDALVAKVRQVKGNCHLGYRSCFAYKLSKKRGVWTVKNAGRRVFDPKKVYKSKA